MDLRILMLILVYYLLIGGTIIASGDTFTADDKINSSISINDSYITEEEIDTPGLFSSGISLGRFFSLLTFGVGLPKNTPDMMALLFALWQSIFTLFTLGFLISSIWDG